MHSTIHKWLSARAIAWHSCRMHAPLNADEIAAVERICGGAAVIGLGEMTHGSKELFQARARLVKHLVEHGDLRIIVLETNLAATPALNRYVLSGDGIARNALSATGYWSTANGETLELIEWLRDYNGALAAQRKPVQVWGCDVQSIDHAADELKRRVSAFVADGLISAGDCDIVTGRLDALPTDRELYRHIEELIAAASSQRPNADEIEVLQARRAAYMDAARDSTAEIVCLLRRMSRQLASRTEADDAFVFERCIRSLEQVVQFYSPHGESARDPLMAENVLALREHFRGEKLAILAHNLHVMRSPLTIRERRFESLGYYLHRQLHDDYKVIGSAFHHGEYVASPGEKPADVELAQAHTPRDDTWEHHCQLHCAASGLPAALLTFTGDLGADESYSTKHLQMRLGEAGRQGSYQDSFMRQSPLDQYDGLLFVSETSGISVLPEYFRIALAKWRSESG